MSIPMTFHNSFVRTIALVGLALLTTTATSAKADGTDTYIAVGDSYAYGVTTYANIANPGLGLNNYYGLQGYVQPFSQVLGTQQTINLALPGETTTSFSTGSNPNTEVNLNYALGNYGLTLGDSQAAALGKTLSYETVHSHTISDLTIQLGGNDLLGAVFNDPGFLNDSPAAEEAFVTGQLATLGTGYGALLQSLRLNPALAGTQVYVIGYFDPFADLGANDPFGLDPLGNQLSGDFVQALNATLQADATAASFHFVDPYAAFRDYPGNHADLSYINFPLGNPGYPANTPNFHPTPLGYDLLAQQIQAAAVPEASTTVSFRLLLALGLASVLVSDRRKKAGKKR